MRYIFILVIFFSIPALAQPPADALVQSFDRYRRQSLTEKLFLHTDQSVYLTGETLWFKAYYVDGAFHKPLDLSKVAYVELLDKEQRSVLQAKVPLTAEGGNGTLFLPASLNAGTYVLRAYTRWMQNFSADYFFEKTLTIVNPFKPLGLPLLPALPDYAVQVFPEGGQLVQGLPGRVAFQVTDASGRGVAVQGWLLNAQNDTLTRFRTHKFGIGTFEVSPVEGAAYRIVLRDGQGQMITRPLPAVQARGYVMRVDEAPNNQLSVTVSTNAGGGGSVYLFAHTRNDVKIADRQSIDQRATFLIDKARLGEGVSHLTVFDGQQKPVCERLYFRRPTQNLRIAARTNQTQYAPRTTVRLDLSTAGASASASRANLSMAVYRVDSLAAVESGSILSYLWMTSDLRGAVESPDYYLKGNDPDVDRAADNLMLTHGWRRFRWDEVVNPSGQTPRRFIPERNALTVEGTISDPTTNKAMPEINAFLSAPGKPVRLYASRSDRAGRIRFELPDYYGMRSLIAQTNPEDSLYKITIDNPFSEAPPATKFPTLAINEAQSASILDRSVAMQVQATYLGDRLVQYRYPAVDSAAFYGKPSETYLLDAYTRFPRMEEVLREYVPGVMPRKRQGRFRLFVPNIPYSSLFETPSLVLVDGVPVHDMDRVIDFSPLKVKQLDVVTNQYFMGVVRYTGIISFMTYKGDLAGYPLDARLAKLDYEGLQIQREFYVPRQPANPRIPDTRTLLYWNPNLKADAQGNVRVEFPTSDEVGTFVIDVNGLDATGHPGSERLRFEVVKSLK